MASDSEKLEPPQDFHPWPHRLAVLLVYAVFPLIWVGGLVTTYEAGMAVPDWPTTFGYNLFLYPWQTWLFGPWDLFIEHGHRLLGALVGLITILLAVTVWACDRRTWMRWLVLGAFLLVCVQGVLGGMRVVHQSNQLAMIHGCVGPVFFALCVSIAAATSSWWRCCGDTSGRGVDRKLSRLAVFTVLFTFVQLGLGAQLRHVPVDATFGVFRVVVFAHLVMALVVTFHIGLLAFHVFRRFRHQTLLRGPTMGLCLLVVLQLLLGAGSWVVNYSWPIWMQGMWWTESFTIQADGMVQALITTAHVANGSLILVTAVSFAIRAIRLFFVAGEGCSSAALAHRSRAGHGQNGAAGISRWRILKLQSHSKCSFRKFARGREENEAATGSPERRAKWRLAGRNKRCAVPAGFPFNFQAIKTRSKSETEIPTNTARIGLFKGALA